VTLHLLGKPDLFGSYARAGLRLARALYAAAAKAPALLQSGTASVQLPGKTARYLFDRKTLHALTGGCKTVRYGGELVPGFREQWDRQRAVGGVTGWRLLRNPEPIVSAAGLAIAPAACRRGEQSVLLWPVSTPAALKDVEALNAAGVDVLGMVEEPFAGAMQPNVPFARIDEGAAGVVTALSRWWSMQRVPAAEQALESLLLELETCGFIEESRVAAALGCPDGVELTAHLRALDITRGIFIPDLGLCSPQFAETMRKGLRRGRRRSPAA
jgi:hypothetical protein